ncbi:MAG: hypothetical protein HY376_02900 [Candidatus Blackburnbacteria bacterium]|nr:hypothetical protein [Candidatus Blackburnbacteria bacterium]
METEDKKSLIITFAIILLALLLLRDFPQSPQAKLNLAALIPCDKEKCYAEASACGANPKNRDMLTINTTCFIGKCESFSENGTMYFINNRGDICQEQFERCTKKCRL